MGHSHSGDTANLGDFDIILQRKLATLSDEKLNEPYRPIETNKPNEG
jgi:hypothetical protein